MAYFPNGTAGELFRSRWCDNCVHDAVYDKPCAVWGAHLLYCYGAKEKERAILDMLIVDNRLEMDDGSSPCKLFLESPE